MAKGNVVALLTAGQANLEERLNGYRSVFAQYPQIKLVSVIDVKGDHASRLIRSKRCWTKASPTWMPSFRWKGNRPRR